MMIVSKDYICYLDPDFRRDDGNNIELLLIDFWSKIYLVYKKSRHVPGFFDLTSELIPQFTDFF